jgi:hypothetical protein
MRLAFKAGSAVNSPAAAAEFRNRRLSISFSALVHYA